MKKYVLLLIMTITLTYTLFGQYFDYVSLGYNTVKLTNKDGEEITFFHYFLNDKQFSKLAFDMCYGLLKTEEKWTVKTRDTLYDGIAVGGFMNKEGDFFYLKEEEGYNFNINEKREIYRVTNGKLVYVEWGDLTSRKIEYSGTGIKVTMRNKEGKYKNDYFMNFYNIPESELYERFMKSLVKRIKENINYTNKERYIDIKDYENRFKRLTKMELELYKNCLLAKYEYQFEKPMWINFMRKYNSYTNGRFLMPEAVENFTGNEIILLKLIQKKLADKYFVIGDYYRTQDNLRLRNNANLSGKVLAEIDKNEWVIVLEEGKTETIDDITSVWVRVKLLNGTEGWCFGGYLGY